MIDSVDTIPYLEKNYENLNDHDWNICQLERSTPGANLAVFGNGNSDFPHTTSKWEQIRERQERFNDKSDASLRVGYPIVADVQ